MRGKSGRMASWKGVASTLNSTQWVRGLFVFQVEFPGNNFKQIKCRLQPTAFRMNRLIGFRKYYMAFEHNMLLPEGGQF